MGLPFVFNVCMENTKLTVTLGNIPQLVSFNKWLAGMGVTNTTGWRWRKKGVIQTTNIYGRLYVTEEAAANFLSRATAGEFALEVKPGKATLLREQSGGDL